MKLSHHSQPQYILPQSTDPAPPVVAPGTMPIGLWKPGDSEPPRVPSPLVSPAAPGSMPGYIPMPKPGTKGAKGRPNAIVAAAAVV